MGQNRELSRFPNAITVLDNGNVGIGTTSFSEGTQPTGTISIIPNSSVSSGPLIQFAGNGRIRPASIGDRLSIDGAALYLNSTFSGNIIMATGGGNVGIGTNIPSEILEVKHPSNNGGAKKYVFKGYDSTGNINGIALRVYDTAGGVSFADVGADYYGTGSDTNLTFSTRSGGGALTERMRITSGGYIASVGRGASDAETSTLLSSLSASTSLFPVPTTNFILQYWKGSNSTNYKLVTSGSSYFTGQHGNNPIDMDLKNNIEKYVGLIVSSADEGYYSVNPMTEEVITGKDAITISESLPRIKLTEIDKDKAVWGVVTNVKNDNYNTDGTFDYDNNTEWGDRLGNTVIRVNGVGEGAIWVTNINGNIDNGDYICSSIIAGYGRKQDDDILHNYSVAKATMSCTFDLNNDNKYLCEEFEFNGQIYKKSFIGCTYHCS
jgi:hypothetical protein